MPRVSTYMSVQDEKMMRDAGLSPSELIQSGLHRAMTGYREPHPLHLLFTALTKLDAVTGNVPGLGRRSQRKQAVMSVVNALYPQSDTTKANVVVVITPIDQ